MAGAQALESSTTALSKLAGNLIRSRETGIQIGIRLGYKQWLNALALMLTSVIKENKH